MYHVLAVLALLLAPLAAPAQPANITGRVTSAAEPRMEGVLISAKKAGRISSGLVTCSP